MTQESGEELAERLEWLAKWLDSYAGKDITSGDDTLAELVRKAATYIETHRSLAAEEGEIADRLFRHIEHGDETHRAWLKSELDKFFAIEALSSLAKTKRSVDI